jgi:hypothetical protein
MVRIKSINANVDALHIVSMRELNATQCQVERSSLNTYSSMFHAPNWTISVTDATVRLQAQVIAQRRSRSVPTYGEQLLQSDHRKLLLHCTTVRQPKRQLISFEWKSLASSHLLEN